MSSDMWWEIKYFDDLRVKVDINEYVTFRRELNEVWDNIIDQIISRLIVEEEDGVHKIVKQEGVNFIYDEPIDAMIKYIGEYFNIEIYPVKDFAKERTKPKLEASHLEGIKHKMLKSEYKDLYEQVTDTFNEIELQAIDNAEYEGGQLSPGYMPERDYRQFFSDIQYCFEQALSLEIKPIDLYKMKEHKLQEG